MGLFNMIRNILFSVITLIGLSSISCKNSNHAIVNRNVYDDIKTDNIAVYVEAHDKAYDITDGNFGDVVVLNLDTKQKHKITDDQFVDEHPVLSPDRRYIVFASMRIGDKNVLKFRGLGGPRQLFLNDLSNGEMGLFAYPALKVFHDHKYNFDGLIWALDNSGLYYYEDGQVLFISIKEDTMYTVYQSNDIYSIDGIALSFDSKLLAISYCDSEYNHFGIRIIDLKKKSTKEVNVDNHVPRLGCWSPFEYRLLYQIYNNRKYYWYEFNYTTGETRSIEMPGINTNIDIYQVNYLTRDTLLILGGDLIYPKDTTMLPYCRYDKIGQYSMNSKEIEWINADGYQKDYLSVYRRLKP
jgi:hypothetical protein